MNKVRTIARIKTNECFESNIQVIPLKQQIIDNKQNRLY